MIEIAETVESKQINDLPNEVLSKIFNFLPLLYLRATAKVCQKWFNLCGFLHTLRINAILSTESNISWRKVCLADISSKLILAVTNATSLTFQNQMFIYGYFPGYTDKKSYENITGTDNIKWQHWPHGLFSFDLHNKRFQTFYPNLIIDTDCSPWNSKLCICGQNIIMFNPFLSDKICSFNISNCEWTLAGHLLRTYELTVGYEQKVICFDSCSGPKILVLHLFDGNPCHGNDEILPFIDMYNVSSDGIITAISCFKGNNLNRREFTLTKIDDHNFLLYGGFRYHSSDVQDYYEKILLDAFLLEFNSDYTELHNLQKVAVENVEINEKLYPYRVGNGIKLEDNILFLQRGIHLNQGILDNQESYHERESAFKHDISATIFPFMLDISRIISHKIVSWKKVGKGQLLFGSNENGWVPEVCSFFSGDNIIITCENGSVEELGSYTSKVVI